MTIKSGAIAAAGLSLAALLGGCGPTVDYQWRSTGYMFSEVSAAADHKDLRVDVLGTPPTGNPAAFAAGVAAAMPRGIGVSANFTATPGPSAAPLYRVVWALPPAGNQQSGAACTAPLGSFPNSSLATGGMYGLFCRGTSVLSGAYARLDSPPDLNDPKFRALIHDMTLSLFAKGNGSSNGY
ncbi:MAG: hypothetical protein JO021_03110 [Alphaproteobacteria bacterium]|nr:hypothetical protein [Alphaproteobacteria bacterium]